MKIKGFPTVNACITTVGGDGKSLVRLMSALDNSEYKGRIDLNVFVNNATEKGIKKINSFKYTKGSFDYLISSDNLGCIGARRIQLLNNYRHLLLFLDDDIVITKHTIRKLVQGMEEIGLDVVGPQMVGHAEKRFNPEVKLDELEEKDKEAESNKNYTETTSVPGGCMLINTSLLDTIGMIDKNFFFWGWGDDYHIQKRAKALGFRVGIIDTTIVYHDTNNRQRDRFTKEFRKYVWEYNYYFANKGREDWWSLKELKDIPFLLFERNLRERYYNKMTEEEKKIVDSNINKIKEGIPILK